MNSKGKMVEWGLFTQNLFPKFHEKNKNKHKLWKNKQQRKAQIHATISEKLQTREMRYRRFSELIQLSSRPSLPWISTVERTVGG